MDREELKARTKAFGLAEFISKIATVAEEADESAFWLELIMDGRLLKPELVSPLYHEAEELTAIFTASGRTAKSNNPKSAIRNPRSKIFDNPKSGASHA